MLEWYSLSGPADTLSKIRHLALCWGTAGHVQPVFLCVGWGGVGGMLYVLGWIGGDSDKLHTGYVTFFNLFVSQIRPSTLTQPHKNTLVLPNPSLSIT